MDSKIIMKMMGLPNPDEFGDKEKKASCIALNDQMVKAFEMGANFGFKRSQFFIRRQKYVDVPNSFFYECKICDAKLDIADALNHICKTGDDK